MNHTKFMSAIRVFGKLALLIVTFLLGIFATAIFAAMLDSAASPRPAQQPMPIAAHEQTPSVPPPAIEQQAIVNVETDMNGSARPDISPLALPGGRTLLTRGATLHMLDAKDRIMWSWSTGDEGSPFITDQPIVDSSGAIYIVGTGQTHFALDASTGCVKWGGMTGSRIAHRQIEKYVDDQYLILADHSGDDDPKHGYLPENVLEAYKGQDLIWSINFPRDAKLMVRKGKIYAVIYWREGSVEMREIEPPDDEVTCSC